MGPHECSDVRPNAAAAACIRAKCDNACFVRFHSWGSPFRLDNKTSPAAVEPANAAAGFPSFLSYPTFLSDMCRCRCSPALDNVQSTLGFGVPVDALMTGGGRGACWRFKLRGKRRWHSSGVNALSLCYRGVLVRASFFGHEENAVGSRYPHRNKCLIVACGLQGRDSATAQLTGGDWVWVESVGAQSHCCTGRSRTGFDG